MIEVGTVLQNRYRVEKQIGQGGMGKVYVATDERFKSTVAIKETVFEDKNLRKAFEREARLLNSLKHQALPRVSDHFVEGDGQFLVMEFIAGEDLAEMMERHGEAFPLEKVLDWSHQLCDALDYLHAQDIIHRDIKPQNLKLTPAGQIVLLDFGLAKGSPADSQQTNAKSIFGYSRSYASLEQIQGTGTEPRSDLYSLGATIYHLLTGIPPVDALTRAMNVLNGKSDPLIQANLINNRVPRGVAEILQKTMALNAGERPVSAAALKQMLEDCDKNVDSSAADAASIVNAALQSPMTTDLLTQETKIKSGETNITPAAALSQARTLVSEEKESGRDSFETRVENPLDDESRVTKIRPNATAAAAAAAAGGASSVALAAENTNSPKRSRAIPAAAVGGLLLACSALAAVYLYNPAQSTRSNSNADAKNEFKIVIANSTEGNTAVFSAVNTNTNLATVVNAGGQPERQTASRSSDTVKKQKIQPEATAKGVNKPKGEEDPDPNVVVGGDRIETDAVIIDENGVRLKNPPRPPRFPNSRQHFPKGGGIYRPLPPEVYRTLTREQIRKLEQLHKMKPGTVVIKPPVPPAQAPTPKP